MSDSTLILRDRSAFQERVHACWLGKAIGGTLGMPHEGKPGPLDLSFYDPVPSEPVPNDDLDLQVMWLMAMRDKGDWLTLPEMGRVWRGHSDFPMDEYGVAFANLSRGILAPASGHYGNSCGDCMGSPIRSEIWAVLAPGNPELAVRMAYRDAIQDHDGEGVWGEVFFAAIESAAFLEPDKHKLIDLGLSFIPAASRVARAVRLTVDAFARCGDWRRVREEVLREFGHVNFTDAPQNIAFTVLGWLSGRDFADCLCTAVNCGQDTDCTGATLGSILGILDPHGIPAAWKRPVSNVLQISSAVHNFDFPKTLQELTEWSCALAEQLSSRSVAGRSRPGRAAEFSVDSMVLEENGIHLSVSYATGLYFTPGTPVTLEMRLANQLGRPVSPEVAVSPPADWEPELDRPAMRWDLTPDGVAEQRFRWTPPADCGVQSAAVTLRIGIGGLASEYTIPFVRSWPWTVRTAGTEQTVWQPERRLWPMPSLAGPVGAVVTAATVVHASRRQYVRVLLAYNGAAKLKLDGKTILDYPAGRFLPFAHRAPRESFHDIELAEGAHQVEVELAAPGAGHEAVLVFADAYSCHIIHDLTPGI